MEQKTKKPLRRIHKKVSDVDTTEYKSIMNSETQDGISVYDYYYLDQNNL